MRHGEDDAKDRKHGGMVVSSGHGEVLVMAAVTGMANRPSPCSNETANGSRE